MALEQLAQYLDEVSRPLWLEYIGLEQRNVRKRALLILRDFITTLQQWPFAKRKQWVELLCHEVLDNQLFVSSQGGTSQTLVIRHPLFRDLLLPVLKVGSAHRSAISYRWIAQLEQYFYSDIRAVRFLGYDFFDTREFLKQALNLNPQDQHTVALLLHSYARIFDYYVHEMPRGLLIEPHIFRVQLAEVEKVVHTYSVPVHWYTDLAEWTELNDAWEAYLEQTDVYDSFEQYLLQR